MTNLKYKYQKQIRDFLSEEHIFNFQHTSVSIEMNAFVRFKNSYYNDLTFYHIVVAEQLVKSLFNEEKKLFNNLSVDFNQSQIVFISNDDFGIRVYIVNEN